MKKLIVKAKKIQSRSNYKDLMDLFEKNKLEVSLTNILMNPSHRVVNEGWSDITMYYELTFEFEVNEKITKITEFL